MKIAPNQNINLTEGQQLDFQGQDILGSIGIKFESVGRASDPAKSLLIWYSPIPVVNKTGFPGL